MLRKRDSCGYDESFEDILVEKKQKVANGSSSKAGHSGGPATNGVINGTPVCTKEDTLIARKRFIAPSQRLFFSDDPLKIVRAQGQYMFDEAGIRYLDCINNVCHVGHCHKRVVEAGYRQMAELNTNSRYLHDGMVKYAAHLASTLPGNLSSFFFTNSGSEANELALQIADVVTGHTERVCVDGAYHGHLSTLLSLSSYKMKSVGPHCIEAPLPDIYHGQYRNPDTAGSLYAGEVKNLIDDAAAENKAISCFIMESLFSCAGQVIPPKGYLQAVYKYIHDAGGLCIADEVQIGFGRVGKCFWGFELQGVVPDIVTIGKPMGNGHPVAGVVTTPEIAERFASTGVSYFNTYGGNPVSMAIAEAVLTVIKEEGLQEHAHSIGEYLLQNLIRLQSKFPTHIGDVRGVGFFIGLDIVEDRESREPHPQLASKIIDRMLLKHKIILSVDGLYKNVIKFKPPLCFSRDNADLLVDCLEEVLSNL